MPLVKVKIGGKEIEGVLVRKVVEQVKRKKRGDKEYTFTTYKVLAEIPPSLAREKGQHGFVVIPASECDEIKTDSESKAE